MPPTDLLNRSSALPIPQYLPNDMSFQHPKIYRDTPMSLPLSQVPHKLAPLLRSPPTPPPEYRCPDLESDVRPFGHYEISGDSYSQSIAAITDRSATLQTQMAFQRQREQDIFAHLKHDLTTWQPTSTRTDMSSTHTSPSTQPRPLRNEDQRRRSTTASAIAPALQIPSAVNSSHGSLAELTAQITCLFWFEPIKVLERAEQTLPASFPEPTMSKEAIPTTGFRKFVTTMLSTTQVAQNVVILALLFIYRLKKQSLVTGKLGSEYRLLTVALMLGNKFLDDNTYTNKTWAEVSGISVTEVHIMEVEFLSNMKYNLYCSAAEWTRWQTLLGRFGNYVDRATRVAAAMPTPILRPAWPTAYSPSPPSSAQLSPVYTTPPHFPGANLQSVPTGPMVPAHSTMAQRQAQLEAFPTGAANGVNSCKRSLEDASPYPMSKRLAYSDDKSNSHQGSESNMSHVGPASGPGAYGQRAQVPATAKQPYIASTSSQGSRSQRYHLPQLPPIIIPSTGEAVTYQSGPVSQSASYQSTATYQSNPPQTNMYALQQQQSSRHQSPYLSSQDASPQNHFQHNMTPNRPTSSAIMYQRNSPYRAVREVSTLLVPPPTRALHQEQVTKDHLHYQPLGRPIEERRTGRLPYVAQNQWLDGQNLKTATPIEQWPCFFNAQVPQQYHHHRQQPGWFATAGSGNGSVSAGRRD